jgi:hypothetical protein
VISDPSFASADSISAESWSHIRSTSDAVA